MTTDVVIAARNEETTIGTVVTEFLRHPQTGNVFLAVDPDTTDDTARMAMLAASEIGGRRHSLIVLYPPEPGKGQCVNFALHHVRTGMVIFCDADITGLNYMHIDAMTYHWRQSGQVILVPEFPAVDSQGVPVPMHVVESWPWVSGERKVPTVIARNAGLHGYLMEVQLNMAMARAGYETSFVFPKVPFNSPLNLSAERLREMERDRKWGLENGIFR